MTTTTLSRKPAKNSILTNFLLDIGLFLVFLTIYEEHATGLPIHEWGALALATVAIVHILLHWKWITACGKCFLQRVKTEIRINYLLNALLFIAFTAVMFSGLMLSKVILPTFGIELGENGFWHWLHAFSADVSLGLVALHIGMHWKWIFNTAKRVVLGSASRKPTPKHQPSVSTAEVE
jgi:hypothetical protein